MKAILLLAPALLFAYQPNAHQPNPRRCRIGSLGVNRRQFPGRSNARGR